MLSEIEILNALVNARNLQQAREVLASGVHAGGMANLITAVISAQPYSNVAVAVIGAVRAAYEVDGLLNRDTREDIPSLERIVEDRSLGGNRVSPSVVIALKNIIHSVKPESPVLLHSQERLSPQRRQSQLRRVRGVWVGSPGSPGAPRAAGSNGSGGGSPLLNRFRKSFSGKDATVVPSSSFTLD